MVPTLAAQTGGWSHSRSKRPGGSWSVPARYPARMLTWVPLFHVVHRGGLMGRDCQGRPNPWSWRRLSSLPAPATSLPGRDVSGPPAEKPRASYQEHTGKHKTAPRAKRPFAETTPKMAQGLAKSHRGQATAPVGRAGEGYTPGTSPFPSAPCKTQSRQGHEKAVIVVCRERGQRLGVGPWLPGWRDEARV